MSQPLVIGATNLDLKGVPQHRLRLGTSNVGSIVRRPGGVAFNVASNLARLGCAPSFVTALGDDADGVYMLDQISRAGLSTAHVHLVKGATATYLAVLDEAGGLAVGVAAMDIYDEWQEVAEEPIRGAQLVVADCNLCPAMLARLTSICAAHRVPLWLDPTASDKCQRIDGLRPITYLCPNRQEMEALAGRALPDHQAIESAAQHLRAGGIENVLVKLDAEGVMSVTAAGTSHHPSRAVAVRDVIGAGDAFSAGVVWGLLQGQPLEVAIEYGIACAVIAIQDDGSNCSALEPQLIHRMVGERACS